MSGFAPVAQQEPEFDLAEKAPLHVQQPPVQQPNQPQYAPPQAAPLSTWSTDLLACFRHMPSVWDAIFCPHCQLARQYNTYMTGTPAIHWPACLSAFGADIVGGTLFGVGVGSWAFAYLVRNRLRQRYNIVGDELSDILLAGFCHCCVVAQNHREMSVRGEFPGGQCCPEQFTLQAPGVPVMGVADE